ncbi:protein-L-isoaspartate(D-aspartate) O-methyltransferase [Streptomyces chengbuensis]|nr:protein-L-isoaspartate(D-aspartate) O-methyltransferase [Streptomyces sp. HUAS CB01]WJY54185.1 protein-L-isoaspartate(D-aspartate) O-methyltransferase [Streptomyces sp. HUAS CB01]
MPGRAPPEPPRPEPPWDSGPGPSWGRSEGPSHEPPRESCPGLSRRASGEPPRESCPEPSRNASPQPWPGRSEGSSPQPPRESRREPSGESPPGSSGARSGGASGKPSPERRPQVPPVPSPDRGARREPGGARPGPEDLVRAARAAGVRDERVLEALRRVPRDAFVPRAEAGSAYRDAPVPLPHGQVTTQPSLVALMVEALGLTGGERVLEIGTGYGFQTAVLARLAGEVVSVERLPDVAGRARRRLARAGIGNVSVSTGDGTLGVPERAPYDAVVVSAAFPEVPGPLVGQLRTGGRLVQPIGPGGREQVRQYERTPRGLVLRRTVVSARFVRLYGVHGYPPGTEP